MANTTKKNNKPVGIPGRDDDFGVYMDQYYANKKKGTATKTTGSTGGKKPTTKK